MSLQFWMGLAVGSLGAWAFLIIVLVSMQTGKKNAKESNGIANDLLRERNEKTMPIRLQVATSALNGYLSGRENPTREMLPGDKHHAEVATACLRYADAMIKRERRSDDPT